MNLFDRLLEIKTGKKNLMKKAIYIPDTIIWDEWTYYIYYYDLVNHTFYFNDIDWPCKQQRPSAINIIEKLVSKAYIQELHSYGDIVKKILQSKKPKVVYFYNQKNTNMIIIDRVNLKSIRNRKWAIIGFKNPTWDNKNSEKVRMQDVN